VPASSAHAQRRGDKVRARSWVCLNCEVVAGGPAPCRYLQKHTRYTAVTGTAHGTPFDLMRAAYHLGNRHVPIELKPDHLKIEPDHVLAGMLRSMHLIVREAEEAFEPEGGAYGAQGHSHGAAPVGPVLHPDAYAVAPAHDHGHDHGGHSHGHAHGHGHSH